MRGSKFSASMSRGTRRTSCRLFDAIVSHCVPVIVSNKLELPFESSLDYSALSLFLSHADSLREGHLLSLLRGMTREEWVRRWRRLLGVQGMFEFQVPARRGMPPAWCGGMSGVACRRYAGPSTVHQRQLLAMQA